MGFETDLLVFAASSVQYHRWIQSGRFIYIAHLLIKRCFSMNKYDGLIYGNGLTSLLLNQLQIVAEPKYKYEFSISDFMKAFSCDMISFREKKELQILFHNLFDSELATNTYEIYRWYIARLIEKEGLDFEQILGKTLIASEEEKETYNSICNSIFPVLYNYWGNNLKGLIAAIFKNDYLHSFALSIREILIETAHIFTTNFDAFTDDLYPKHLHGRFANPLKNENDLIYKFYGTNGDYFYKFLWGHNGEGKRQFIYYMHNHFDDVDCYYDLDFFFNNEMSIDNLLIFGMGFKNSAYSSSISPYEEGVIHKGFVIDDHILLRLSELQRKKQLNNVTFAYYSEKDKARYSELISLYELERTTLVPSYEFDFRI